MLDFKVSSREMTFGKDKGKTKYFAQRVSRPTVGIRQVEDAIVEKTSLARGDVRNAIASLAEVVNQMLLSGISVDLGDLGSFRVEAYGKYQDEARAVTADTIKTPQIRYTPKTAMRRYAQRVRIEVDNPYNKKAGGGAVAPPSGEGSGGSDPRDSGGDSRPPEGGLPL